MRGIFGEQHCKALFPFNHSNKIAVRYTVKQSQNGTIELSW